jgi:hypothetical protein
MSLIEFKRACPIHRVPRWARVWSRVSFPLQRMCPPFYSLRTTHTRELDPDKWTMEYNNMRHGAMERASGPRFSYGGQISSLGHHVGPLARLASTLFCWCAGEGSVVGHGVN